MKCILWQAGPFRVALVFWDLFLCVLVPLPCPSLWVSTRVARRAARPHAAVRVEHDGAKHCQVPGQSTLASQADTGASCCLSLTAGLSYQTAGPGRATRKCLQL